MMMVFDLECINGHTFEGWFEDKDDLDTQMEKGLLQCPACESFSITKKLHPVSIKTSSISSFPEKKSLDPEQAAITDTIFRIAKYMEKNFEDVGSYFADQALKMHYGVCEHKNIRGTATREEEKILAKEGVPVLKIPIGKDPKEGLN